MSPGTYVCTWGTAGRPETAPRGKLRTREYLTEAEVERLMAAAKHHRDATMVFAAYWHGLRASELVNLRWEQVGFKTATLSSAKLGNGSPLSPAGMALNLNGYGST